MFLTRLLSSPKFFTFSSNSLSFSCDANRVSILFSSPLYLTIRSLMSCYFPAKTLCRCSMSFSRLANFYSKYYFMLTSLFPIIILSLLFSSQMAAHDSNCRVSMYPFFSPNQPANDLFYLAKCSTCFCSLMFSFSIFSFLSYNYFINSFSFSSYGLVSLLIFSYLLFISSSNCRFKLTILSSDIWINYRSYFFSFLNFNNSSSCNFFIFCMVSNKSAISLSLALLKEWNFFFSSSKNACDLCF